MFSELLLWFLSSHVCEKTRRERSFSVSLQPILYGVTSGVTSTPVCFALPFYAWNVPAERHAFRGAPRIDTLPNLGVGGGVALNLRTERHRLLCGSGKVFLKTKSLGHLLSEIGSSRPPHGGGLPGFFRNPNG